MLNAIPFGTDGTAGDSTFYAPDNRAEVKDDAEYSEVKQAFLQVAGDDYEEELAGFWLVDDTAYRAMEAVWPSAGCGNDSHVYACNSAAKRIAQQMAKRTVLAG